MANKWISAEKYAQKIGVSYGTMKRWFKKNDDFTKDRMFVFGIVKFKQMTHPSNKGAYYIQII